MPSESSCYRHSYHHHIHAVACYGHRCMVALVCLRRSIASVAAVAATVTHGPRPLQCPYPWPADLRSTAASSADAVLEIVDLIDHYVGTYHRARNPQSNYSVRTPLCLLRCRPPGRLRPWHRHLAPGRRAKPRPLFLVVVLSLSLSLSPSPSLSLSPFLSLSLPLSRSLSRSTSHGVCLTQCRCAGVECHVCTLAWCRM